MPSIQSFVPPSHHDHAEDDKISKDSNQQNNKKYNIPHFHHAVTEFDRQASPLGKLDGPDEQEVLLFTVPGHELDARHEVERADRHVNGGVVLSHCNTHSYC